MAARSRYPVTSTLLPSSGTLPATEPAVPVTPVQPVITSAPVNRDPNGLAIPQGQLSHADGPGDTAEAFAQNWQQAYRPTRQSFAELANTLVGKGFDVSRPTNASGLSNDKLVINGQMYDLVTDEGGPAAQWAWNQVGGGGGGTDTAGLLSALGGSSFSDPDTARLLAQINQRVAGLSAPMGSAAYDQFASSASELAKRLQTPYENPNSAQTMALLQRILGEVSGDPYTSDQWSTMRAEANDEITRARDMDARTTLARMAALGHGKGSGTIAEAMRQVESDYQGNRAANERALRLAAIQQGNQNRNTAVSVSQLMRDIPMQDEQFATNRSGQAVQLLQALTQAETARRAEQMAREATITELLGVPVQLGDQRLAQALQVLGVAGDPGDTLNIINTLSGLARSAENTSLVDQQRNAALWEQVGKIIAGM